MTYALTCQHPGCSESDHPSTTWGGTLLCGLHLRGMQADIDDIARVLTLVEEHHADLSQPGGSGGDAVRSVPSSRPPLRLDVIDVVSGRVAAIITGWAADVVRTSREMGVPEAARLLARNADALFCHPAVGVVAEELRDAAADCRRVLPDDRWQTAEQDAKPKVLGRCQQPHESDPMRCCGGPLVWLRSTLVVRCTRCHHEQEPDGWVSKRVVLRAFGLARRTLNRWIADGKVGASGDFVCVDDVRTMVHQGIRRHAGAEGA